MHKHSSHFTDPRPLTGCDALSMANIHGLCFPDAWTEELFFDCFTKPEWDGVFGFGIEQSPELIKPPHPVSTQSTSSLLAGFILGRTTYETNDILTFAVNPAYQGIGIGRTLLTTYLNAVSCACLLEVATSNTAAIHLYNAFGFEIIASRRDYYDSPDPAMRDAYVMGRRGMLSKS